MIQQLNQVLRRWDPREKVVNLTYVNRLTGEAMNGIFLVEPAHSASLTIAVKKETLKGPSQPLPNYSAQA